LDLFEQASGTIGDTSIVAGQISGAQGDALTRAGGSVFAQAHSVSLTTAAGLIALLAVVVFFTLAGYRIQSHAHH
jgi:DHA2 family multidrug resistance protein-like MFS transporter